MKKYASLVIILSFILAIGYFANTGEILSSIFNKVSLGQARAVDEPADNKGHINNNENSAVEKKPGKDDEPVESYLERTVVSNEEGKKIIKEPSKTLVLVNKKRNLPAGYEPPNLVIPNIPFPFKENLEKKYLRKIAAGALEELFKEVKNKGLDMYGLSGYRSYTTQKNIFDYKAEMRGEEVANKTSARPGQSEHQTGLAMDVTSPKVNFRLLQSFGETEEGIWLAKNAHKFGFIIRYPEGKEDITGYSYEPWHLRYVGKDIAEDIYEERVTLEEYMAKTYTGEK